MLDRFLPRATRRRSRDTAAETSRQVVAPGAASTGVEYVEVTTTGVPFVCAVNASSTDLYTEWIRSNPPPEAPVTWARRLVEPDSVVLDIGANVGLFSFAIASSCAYVVAVEAAPRNAALLALGAAANAHIRVVPVHAAAADDRGTVASYGESAWSRTEHADDGPTPGLTVDDIQRLFSARPFDLVKVDIEGWEEQVIPGVLELAADRERFVLIYEANQAVADRDVRNLHRRVSDAGFRLWYLDPNTSRAGSVDLDAPQYTLNCDVLAIKGAPSFDLSLEPFADGFMAERLAQELVHAHPLHRAYAHAIVDRTGFAAHRSVDSARRNGREHLDESHVARFSSLVAAFDGST